MRQIPKALYMIKAYPDRKDRSIVPKIVSSTVSPAARPIILKINHGTRSFRLLFLEAAEIKSDPQILAAIDNTMSIIVRGVELISKEDVYVTDF